MARAGHEERLQRATVPPTVNSTSSGCAPIARTVRPAYVARGSAKHGAACASMTLNRATHVPRGMLRSAGSSWLSPQGVAQRRVRHLDTHAGALLLERHRHPAVPLAPAPLHRLRKLIERNLADAHRHADLGGELHRQGYILMR